MGAYVYLSYRSPTLLAYRKLAEFGFADALEWMRHHSAALQTPREREVLFTLPDGLWVYALTACMILIWRGEDARVRYPWILAGVVLGAGGEIGQRLGMVPGTFDMLDLVAILLGFAGAVLLTPQGGSDAKAHPLAVGTDRVRASGRRKHGWRSRTHDPERDIHTGNV